MSQKAKVANAHEAGRQQVEQEASKKLGHGESHQSLLVAVSRVPPAESDLTVGEGHQTMVGDRHAVSVAAEVA